MVRPVPLFGKALKSFERGLTIWALKALWREIRSGRGGLGEKLRAAMGLRKVSRTYMAGLKPVRFGPSVKVGLYMPHWPGRALRTRISRALSADGAHCHEQVMLSVTDRCPYKCPHCFNTRKPQPPMAAARLRRLVGEIQECGGSWICIHGGEPLVDLERTLAVVDAADGRTEMWLATTGYGLDAKVARRLRRGGLFGACVSLHHYEPARHDEFVVYPGAFDIAVKAIELLRREDVFITLNTTLPQERITAEEIARTMELAKDLGAGMVELLFIRPAGRAVLGCLQLLPEEHDLRVLEAAMEQFNKGAEFSGYPALVSPAYFETPERFGCVAGNERIFISAAGDLQPCAMVNLSIGNVAEEGFAPVAARMRRLLPCPRKDLLCTQLQPVIGEKLRSLMGSHLELPLSPQLSAEILRDLPRPEPPAAYDNGRQRRAAGAG